MLRLPNCDLDTRIGTKLESYQAKVNAIRKYQERVEEAKRLFSIHNTSRNIVFKNIRSSLAKICPGFRRCCYCEDSGADEIEHVKPKDLFPQFVFLWENYVYACGSCNRIKSNRFHIFHSRTGKEQEITHKHGEPIRQPPKGDSLLIDPRQEDPLEYLELDLQDTFYLMPRYGLRGKQLRRAEYTIQLLQLNDRDLLPRVRRNAFTAFRARLNEYVQKKTNGIPAIVLNQLRQDLLDSPHPTVWAEMKRQHQCNPELNRLFQQVPEALNW